MGRTALHGAGNEGQVTDPLYTTEILRLAASLHEPHALDHEHGRAELRSPTCGSRVTLAVQLDGNRRVERLSIEVHACAFGQASAALLERHSRGRTHDEVSEAMLALSHWLAGDRDDSGWPGINALAPARERKGRHGAILLPFRALLAAMDAA
jgi:NifU-like protein involved in Fe-S cluster formation